MVGRMTLNFYTVYNYYNNYTISIITVCGGRLFNICTIAVSILCSWNINHYLFQNDASNRITAIDPIITQQLIQNSCPKCGLGSKTIDDSRLSCREGYLNNVHYQARIRGTRNYSADGLVSLLDEWVQSGRAYITLYSTRLYLSSQCTTILDSPTASDCLRTIQTTTTSSPVTTNGVTPTSSKAVFGGPQIGGLIVGIVIALLLLVLVIVVVLLVLRTFKHSG